MKPLLSIAVLILTVLPVAAQHLPTKSAPVVPNVPGKFKAVAPSVVKAGNHFVIDATSAKGDVEFDFDSVAFPKERATYADGKKMLILSTDTNGIYRITVYSWDDKAKERIEVKVTGGDGPDPIPDPTPIPTDPLEALKMEVRAGFAKMDVRLRLLEQIKPIPPPPDPKPPLPPEPSPIPVAGFRVMIIEDKAKLGLMPAAQLEIRTSPVIRDYLEANCVAESPTHKSYRIWDFKTLGGLKVWQDAMARPRNYSYTDAAGKAVHVTNHLPWIIISNYPSGGYEGPLPASVEETLTLLKKVKGN